MSDDLKSHFKTRAQGDAQSMAATYRANTALATLMTSLTDLKGKGFDVEVGNLKNTVPDQDGETYKAPVVLQTVKVTHNPGALRANKEAELTVTLDLDGKYSFEATGAVASDLSDTSVSNQAANNVQQWLVDVQAALGIDVLSTAMARQAERAEAKRERSNPKPS